MGLSQNNLILKKCKGVIFQRLLPSPFHLQTIKAKVRKAARVRMFACAFAKAGESVLQRPLLSS